MKVSEYKPTLTDRVKDFWHDYGVTEVLRFKRKLGRKLLK